MGADLENLENLVVLIKTVKIVEQQEGMGSTITPSLPQGRLSTSRISSRDTLAILWVRKTSTTMTTYTLEEGGGMVCGLPRPP